MTHFANTGWTIELESGWDDDGWTRVPTNITRDTSLSWKAKGLVAFLAGHTRGFRITREFIIGASSDGETSVRAGLKELREAGYLMYRRGQGSNGAYILRRFPTSNHPSGKPPMVETTHGGNHGQRKTKFQEDHSEEDQKDIPSPAGDDASDDLALEFAPDVTRVPSAKQTRLDNERALDAEFEAAFWPAYPRKVGKHAARTAYRRVRRSGVTVEELTAAVQRFAAAKVDTEARFIAHGATWLNGGRWLDEPDAPSATSPAIPHKPWLYRDEDHWSTP